MSMLANLVRETCTNPGTGAFSLNGSPLGYVPFVQAFGTGASCFYVARSSDLTLTEIGRGTVTAGTPNTLSRDLVIWNSQVLAANPTKLSFTGMLDVYCEAPAERTPVMADDGSLSLTVGGTSSLVKRASDFLAIGVLGTGFALTTSPAVMLTANFTACGTRLFGVATAGVDYTDSAGTVQDVTMLINGPLANAAADVTNVRGEGFGVGAAGKLALPIAVAGLVIGNAYTLTISFSKQASNGTAVPRNITFSAINF